MVVFDMGAQVVLDTVADWARFRMYQRQWSGRHVARHLGMSTATVSRILNGRNADPHTLWKVAKWAGMTPKQFCESLEHSATPNPSAGAAPNIRVGEVSFQKTVGDEQPATTITLIGA